jgi:UDP-N-acetylmuramoyl-tripeptide--D-alanyl-D-alanine ligase
MTEGREGRKRLLVIAGEMLELGPEEASLHRATGREIAETGVNVLWGVRGLARELVSGASEGGLSQTRFFESSEDAATEIVKEVKEGDLVLVKGSRGVATEKLVNALKAGFPLAGEDVREGQDG